MWRRPLSVITILAVLSTACGDDTGPPDAEPAADTSTTSAPSGEPTTTTTAEETTADHTPLVDVAWLRDPANDYRLVDARNADNHATGSLPGARHIDASELNEPGPVPYQLGAADHVAAILGAEGITADDTIVLYDDDGSLYAARIYWALTYYGHDDLRILDGGLGAWTAAGGELETTPPPDAVPVVYEITETRTELRLELADVQAALGAASFADARSVGEFDGTVDLGTEQVGHIPGAGNVDYVETIDTDGRFLPTADLRSRYEDAGVLPTDDVVTYCLVGARAAHAWFVLSELLGYPSVGLYDGSWQEYGNTAGADVES